MEREGEQGGERERKGRGDAKKKISNKATIVNDTVNKLTVEFDRDVFLHSCH